MSGPYPGRLFHHECTVLKLAPAHSSEHCTNAYKKSISGQDVLARFQLKQSSEGHWSMESLLAEPVECAGAAAG